MAERLHPGVYVEEVSGGVKPIEGVSTSTAAFVGEAARGIPAQAQFVTSFSDFEKLFGGFVPGERGYLAHAVSGFFDSGGKRAYIVRVLPRTALKGQSDPVASRVGGQNPASALQFVARGAGVWSTNLRIAIGKSTNFPGEAFRVDLLWSENGALRRLPESYDDVRMDPSHEDYVVERMKRSKYVEVVDLVGKALDVPSPPTLIAAQPPRLKAVAPDANAKYSIPDGKTFTVTSWDVNQPDSAPTGQVAAVTKAQIDAAIPGNQITVKDGRFELDPAQLSAVLNKQLTGFDIAADASPPDLGIKVGKAPITTISPAAGNTYDMSGPNNTAQALRVTINNTPPVNVAITAANLAQTTAAEIAQSLIAANLGLGVTVQGNNVVVTGISNAAAAPVLTIASSPTANRIQTAATEPGTQGPGGDRFDGLRLSIAEAITATRPPVLRVLGFPAQARGYAANSQANPALRPAPTTNATLIRVTGGSDGQGPVTSADYQGDARERTGLHALDGVEVNMVALPGKNDIGYLSVGIGYCDNRGDCFFIADGPGSGERGVEVKPDDARAFVDSLPARSKNAAMFYPWIQVPDPVGIGRNPTRFIAPSGHVAGIFARTDITRGVWKAPAGIEATVTAAYGLQSVVLDADQDRLNPASLNCLRQFPGVGIVSWGTRTLSADPEWRYVPVRRMGLFLKESLRRGMQWAVFEPNDEELWGRIKINITAFMTTLFRQGAFQGATPDEAFAVACDRSTNPQENVDAGIVTAKVAFAPLKPAEFVVIEVSQKSLLVA